MYTENQHCDITSEVLFTVEPYCNLQYLTFLRVVDLHTAIKGYMSLFYDLSCVFFPSCQVPNASQILCFTLFMPPTHRQNIDRMWHVFPSLWNCLTHDTVLFQKELESVQKYCWRVGNLNTPYRTKLNSQLKNVHKWLRYVKNVYFKKWQHYIHTLSLTTNTLAI
jgi:hypothetical protein